MLYRGRGRPLSQSETLPKDLEELIALLGTRASPLPTLNHLGMRTITLIIVHCSANRAGSTLRMADIDRYHRSLGWKGCGYHYVIPTDGTIERGRPEAQIGAHCKNHNRHSIGVAYIGGLAGDGKTPCDTRTEAQKSALKRLLGELHKRYPKALIVGHCDLDPQKPYCPGFRVGSGDALVPNNAINSSNSFGSVSDWESGRPRPR